MPVGGFSNGGSGHSLERNRQWQRGQFTKKASEFRLADKPCLGISLSAVNFFPGAFHKRPSTSLATIVGTPE